MNKILIRCHYFIPSQANEMLHHKANLNGYLAYHTGQSLEKINQDTDRDFFMSAKEAKEYGLIDGVILNPLKALQPLAATADQWKSCLACNFPDWICNEFCRVNNYWYIIAESYLFLWHSKLIPGTKAWEMDRLWRSVTLCFKRLFFC